MKVFLFRSVLLRINNWDVFTEIAVLWKTHDHSFQPDITIGKEKDWNLNIKAHQSLCVFDLSGIRIEFNSQYEFLVE